MKIYLLAGAMGLASLAQAQCDPWIQKAYQQIMGRGANAQECNIKNYNNGSWNNYAELVGYIAGYQRKGDPWIYQAYTELYNRVPNSTEVNIRNYNNGSWNSYSELKRYIQNYQNGLAQAQAAARAEKQSLIYASYMMSFGRLPQGSEVNYWMNQSTPSFKSFLENHRDFAYNQDANTRRELITRSYIDILGRKPTEDEISYWTAQRKLYIELTKNHVEWLANNSAEYDKVISRSYQTSFGRPASGDEISYWRRQGVLSYAVLLSCHDDWKRRNRSGTLSGQSSTSSSSSFLATVGVSNTVSNDIKNTIGSYAVAPGGGNVISPGGGNVISPGGGNVIAPGGGNVIAPGGGNVIAPGGANFIGIGGAGVVAAGGMN